MNEIVQGGGFNPPGQQQPPHYTGEIAATNAAALAKASVESRYIIALRQPRNWDQVRQDLLRECRRPAFANNKSAYYRKPIGAGVEGLGIRFVEVAIRCMKNVMVESVMVFEDEQKEVHRVTVTDLESNVTYPGDVKVSKTVERSKPADDGTYLAVRRNSWNKMVYTVTANDDDLLNKRAAQISKMVRTLGLRLIPGDLQDEGEAIIKSVRMDEAAHDPEAERKRLADAFMAIGVKAQQLTAYLGHEIATCSPAELVDLRGLYGAIKDGEATWAQVMENKSENEGNTGGSAGAGGENKPASTAANDKVKEAMKARREGKGAPAAPPASTGQGKGDEPTAEALRDQLMKAPDEDAAGLVLDRARHLGKDDYDSLVALLDQRFPKE